MEEVLEVIEQARESYLSKDGQLKVIYDAYSKYKRNVEFMPSALVASEEAREAAQPTLAPDDAYASCPFRAFVNYPSLGDVVECEYRIAGKA